MEKLKTVLFLLSHRPTVLPGPRRPAKSIAAAATAAPSSAGCRPRALPSMRTATNLQSTRTPSIAGRPLDRKGPSILLLVDHRKFHVGNKSLNKWKKNAPFVLPLQSPSTSRTKADRQQKKIRSSSRSTPSTKKKKTSLIVVRIRVRTGRCSSYLRLPSAWNPPTTGIAASVHCSSFYVSVTRETLESPRIITSIVCAAIFRAFLLSRSADRSGDAQSLALVPHLILKDRQSFSTVFFSPSPSYSTEGGFSHSSYSDSLAIVQLARAVINMISFPSLSRVFAKPSPSIYLDIGKVWPGGLEEGSRSISHGGCPSTARPIETIVVRPIMRAISLFYFATSLCVCQKGLAASLTFFFLF